MASLSSSSAGDDVTSGAAACGALTGVLTVFVPADGAKWTAVVPAKVYKRHGGNTRCCCSTKDARKPHNRDQPHPRLTYVTSTAFRPLTCFTMRVGQSAREPHLCCCGWPRSNSRSDADSSPIKPSYQQLNFFDDKCHWECLQRGDNTPLAHHNYTRTKSAAVRGPENPIASKLESLR